MRRLTLRVKMMALAVLLALGGMTIMTASVAVAGSTAPRYGSHVTYSDCAGPYSGNYYHCWADWDWFAEVFWGKRDWYVWVQGWYTA